MRNKENIVFIKHILDSINAIEDFSKGMSRKELSSNRMKQSAIVREIEVIGEAVKNISDNLKENYSSVPWKEIVGTRDKMIHHYFGVDLDIIWNIVKKDLPKLKLSMEKIERELENKN